MKLKVNTPAAQPVIPETGYVRIAQILGCQRRGWVPILAISRSALYLWIRDGRWPAPQKLGAKIVAWEASVVRDALEGMKGSL
jgi:prophage regulatory protein